MVQQAEEAKRNCERVVKETGRKLQCEVWRQQGSGKQRFDMMGKRLYKSYQSTLFPLSNVCVLTVADLTNIVVRLSDGTDAGKEHALLLNSHLDSTLPSPGAADDAISVGIMLDCIRVLVDTPEWSPAHAVIFCTRVRRIFISTHIVCSI
jgi:Zn-dependent M28 family amino/carboxypeptidase